MGSGMTPGEMCERTMVFALRCAEMTEALPTRPAALNAGKQIIRASASVAANYRASQRGKSRPDFANKVAIVLEEADESLFWLEYIERGGYLAPKRLELLRGEADDLVRIFATMLASARKR